jgi:hypothetical protein
MRKFVYLLAILVFSAIAFNSCSNDSSTTPTVSGNLSEYYPLALGNNWKYKVDTTDASFNTIKTGGNFEMFVNKSLVYNSKSCFEVITKPISLPEMETDTAYQYTSGSSLFQYGFSFTDGPTVNNWLERYNISKPVTFLNLDSSITDPLPAKFKINMTSKPLSSTGSFVYNGKTYSTIELEEIQDTYINFFGMSATVKTVSKYSLVKGIGIVKALIQITITEASSKPVLTYMKHELVSTNVL